MAQRTMTVTSGLQRLAQPTGRPAQTLRTSSGTGVCGTFTRQRPQVRNLSRPPAKTPPRLDPSGRLPEDLPEDHGLRVVERGQPGSIRAVGEPTNSCASCCRVVWSLPR